MTNATNPLSETSEEIQAGATEQPENADFGTDLRARPIPRITIQGFCENEATADSIQQASQDRRLAKTHVTVQMGGAQAASAFYQTAPTPNLIILESTHERSAMLADLDHLAEVCDAGTKVIVIGHMNDVLLYRELLNRGVSEYLIAPVTPLEIMESISNLYNDPQAAPIGHVIAFIGAKGGVGSSAICHNTAWAISEAIGNDVVIADFDLPFGTASLDFNQDPVQGIADALSSPERLDEVLLDRLLVKCSEHLSLFAAPGTLEREYDLTSEACGTVLDVVRQNVPYVMVDVPHMWTSWAKQVLYAADEIVITAAPDLANLRNMKNLIELLKNNRQNDNPPKIVFNQVGVPKRPEISVRDFESAIGLKPIAVINYEAELFGTAANNGQMIEEVSSKSPIAEQFRDLAYRLTYREEPKTEGSKSVLAPLLSKLNLTKPGA